MVVERESEMNSMVTVDEVVGDQAITTSCGYIISSHDNNDDDKTRHYGFGGKWSGRREEIGPIFIRHPPPSPVA